MFLAMRLRRYYSALRTARNRTGGVVAGGAS
jgi:hypothetical protein